MERKRFLEIVMAVILILLLVGVIWWLLRSDQVGDQLVDSEAGQGSAQIGDIETLDLSGYEVSAATIARVFVERFGSFSNTGDYENINAVMNIATDALQSRLLSLMDAEQTGDQGVYYGISTYVLSMEQIEIGEDREVLEVLTQREEAIDSPSNTSVKYQTIRLTLVKDGSSWLVDDFVWAD